MMLRMNVMKDFRNIVLILILFVPFNIMAQFSHDGGNKDLPKLLKNAYQERTIVLKQDTISYKRRWFIPDEYKLQYAGEIGFLSLGFGYRISKVYHPALYFGYVSEDFGADRNSVFTVSLKNNFYVCGERLFKGFRPYVGASLNWMSAHNSFRHLPDYYPDNYYFQNKLHLMPYVGGEKKFKLNWNYFNSIGVYGELGAIDAYLLEAIRTEYITLGKVLSLGLGVTFYLK